MIGVLVTAVAIPAPALAQDTDVAMKSAISRPLAVPFEPGGRMLRKLSPASS